MFVWGVPSGQPTKIRSSSRHTRVPGRMNTTEVEGYGYDPCQDLLAFTQYHGNNHDDFQLMAEFHEQIGPNPVVSDGGFRE